MKPETVTTGKIGQAEEVSPAADKPGEHHVVIIGGGFGGLWAALALKRANVRVTVIDKRNFHLFQPLLYQVATGGLSPADIASPLRSVLARQKNTDVLLGEMTGVDYQTKEVILKDGRVSYDTLILAPGSVNFFFGHDRWEQHAPGLKGLEDALVMRRKIFGAFEAAEREENPQKRKELLTFVVVGGGATGVELAGAIGEIARITLRGDFRKVKKSDIRIVLLEGGPRLLPSFPEKLAASAAGALARLGVESHTGAFVTTIDETGVTVKENDREYRIPSRTVMWGAGVKPSPLGKALVGEDSSLLDRTGRIKVSPDLTLPGHDDVFVIGDLANYSHQTGEPLPGVAPVAMSQGRYVGKTVARRLKGKPIKEYKYFNKGSLAVIGRAAAVADFGWARFSGYPAWLLWLFVHLMYLVEYDNRLMVFIQWAWNYFTRNRGARLITYDLPRENR